MTVFRMLTMLCLLFGGGFCAGQIPGTDHYNPSERWTAEEQLADFEIFRTTLEEVHPGLYRYASKITIDAHFDTLKLALSQPLTDWELHQAFSRFIANIGCGHTYHLARLRYYRWLERHGRYLPWAVRRMESSLYVEEDLGGKEVMTRGRYVIALNNKIVQELLNQIDRHVASDGYHQGYKDRITSLNFGKFLHAYAVPTVNHASLASGDGVEQLNVSLQGLSFDSLSRQRKALNLPEPEAHTVQWWPEEQAAYLKVRSLGDPEIYSTEKAYRKFLAQTFREIENNGVKNVVLDLRDNGGGSTARELLLCEYLSIADTTFTENWLVKRAEAPTHLEHTNKPSLYTYQDEMLVTGDSGWYHYNVEMRLVGKPPKHPYQGKLYVLTNGGTFSAAAILAQKVKQTGRGTLLGQETGGLAGGTNAGVFLRLDFPNTKGKAIIPLVAIHHRDLEGLNPRKGIVPDVVVPWTQDDLAARNDPVIDAVRRLISKR